LLCEVYAAGEEPIDGADGRALTRGVRARGKVEPVFLKSVQEVPAALDAVLQDGDLVLTLGAGDIGGVPVSLGQYFSRAQK
jgi:UDP-N-acetylmuramate--alanine ligase